MMLEKHALNEKTTAETEKTRDQFYLSININPDIENKLNPYISPIIKHGSTLKLDSFCWFSTNILISLDLCVCVCVCVLMR